MTPQELYGDMLGYLDRKMSLELKSMKWWVGEMPFLGELSLSKELPYSEKRKTLSLKSKLSHTVTQRHYLRLLMKP